MRENGSIRCSRCTRCFLGFNNRGVYIYENRKKRKKRVKYF
nr:MAG TPA: CGGC domain protein [Caudoviricetes sp.]